MSPLQPDAHQKGSKVDDDNGLLPLFLDGILMQALLRNPTDRDFILSAEAQLLTDLFTKDTIEFPQLNSYYRMMLHRIARYYNMNHFYNYNKEKEKIILEARDSGKKKPVFSLRELVEPEILAEEEKKKSKTKNQKDQKDQKDQEKQPEEDPSSSALTKKFKIMKRPAHKGAEGSRSKELQNEKPQKSVQEKEADYERARSRLFADLPLDDGVENRSPEDNEDYYYKEVKEEDGDYFNYQYHVPYYPSYYFQQQQQPSMVPQQQLQPQALNAAKPKMMYSTDLKDVPVPRHILILSIGKLNNTLQSKHSLKTKSYQDPIDGDEVTLIIFPSVDLASDVLKNGLGNMIDILTVFL